MAVLVGDELTALKAYTEWIDLVEGERGEDRNDSRYFQKKPEEKETTIPSNNAKNDVPEGIMTKCPECKNIILTKELIKHVKSLSEM